METIKTITTAVGSALLTAFAFWVIDKVKQTRLARVIDILLLRIEMRRILKDCERDGARTALDTAAFYEIYEVYTKNLKQNSYICNIVEPAFKNIKEE